MEGSKTKALSLLVAVFVAGIMLGWVTHAMSVKERLIPRQDVEALMSRFSKELDLTPDQQDSVRAILSRRQQDSRVISMETRPRYQALRDRAKAEIEMLLTPDQKTRYEALNAEMDRELELLRRARGNETQGQR